jgi:hypothetical protein
LNRGFQALWIQNPLGPGGVGCVCKGKDPGTGPGFHDIGWQGDAWFEIGIQAERPAEGNGIHHRLDQIGRQAGLIVQELGLCGPEWFGQLFAKFAGKIRREARGPHHVRQAGAEDLAPKIRGKCLSRINGGLEITGPGGGPPDIEARHLWCLVLIDSRNIFPP